MKKYKSPIFKHIHQEATDRFEVGAISAEEMRRYDSSCLVSPADTPQGRSAAVPAMAAGPGTQGRSVK
jgi:putative transcriptional regulator